MAKKKNEKVVLEDIELKPQVIGHIYEKKTNIGRVIIIFVIFSLVVYFINDISVFFNNLIGKKSADTIKDIANDERKNRNKEESKDEEDEYYLFEDGLSLSLENLTIAHFNYNNNVLSFDVYNYSDNDIDLSNKNYYLETYNSSKSLLDTLKVDFNKISKKNKISINLDLNKEFTYLKFVEKSVDDYPNISLNYDSNGLANIVCQKNNDTITYTFNTEGLIKISDVYTDSNNIDNYYLRYANSQNKVNTYNNINGIEASFSSVNNGYMVTINVDLEKANLDDIEEKYFYSYKENAKVINYEMTSYGYSCK